MPAKSRRNRRKIQSRRTSNGGTVNTAAEITDYTKSTFKGGNTDPVSSDLKGLVIIEPKRSDVIQELKWIGIVTGIVFVCLAVAYIFFR